MNDWKSDIVCFSETWLQPTSTTNSHLCLPNYSFFRRDRPNRTHGGILVYTRTHLDVRRRTDLEHDDIECVTLDFNMQGLHRMILFCCYRPPNSNANFFNILSNLVSMVEHKKCSIVLVGDFNAKHHSWDPNSTSPNTAGSQLQEMILDFCLTQVVQEPTRYSSDFVRRSVLDLFVTSRPDQVKNIEVTDPISDHCCIHVTLECVVQADQCKSSVTFPDYKNADWSGLRVELLQTPFLQAMAGTHDVDIAWQVWEQLFKEKIRKFLPFRSLCIRQKNASWMTSDLHRLSRQKKRLFRVALSRRSLSDWEKYKICRNRCTTEFRKAKTNYFTKKSRELQEETDGSHRWWSLAKRLCKISTQKQELADLEDKGIQVSMDVDKADLLANFFASQCSADSEDDALINAPFPLPEKHPTFQFGPVSEQTVLRHLLQLSPSKSTADNFCSNLILRECAPLISSSLAYLFNLSISTSSFPSAWKQAIVTPLFKQRGSRSDPSNYRPVSLLPAVGKVLDSIQSSRLLKYFLKHQLISNHQFGFLPGKSTVQQLIYVIDKWCRSCECGEAVHAVFLDFMKAFDRVWHHGLLHKLQANGIMYESVAWLRSYLSRRTIRVRVGGALSSPQPINAGVPQGSHLGPVLFLVFINDLPTAMDISTEMYADDALLHRSSSCLATLQPAITAAETWALSWHGQFGHAKTKLLLINEPAPSLHPVPFIESQEIDVVSTHKHLGITLTESLEWHTHVSQVISQGKKRAGLLRWMGQELPREVISRLYIFYVRPTLEYGSPIWHGSLREVDAIALERIQASVARIILNAPRDLPKATIFAQLNWPSLRWRREIACLTLLHRIIYEKPEPCYSSLFPFSGTKRATRKPLNFILPPTRTSKCSKSFYFRTSLLWNSLPQELQNIKQPQRFKKGLKAHLQKFCFSTNNEFIKLTCPL